VVEQRDAQVGSLPAYTVEAVASTQQGDVRVLAYYIGYDDRVYEFLGYARSEDFSAYRPGFTATMRGFAPLNDPDILNIQPTRMAVRPANRTATFQAFLPSTFPEGFSADGLAILNQVTLDEQIDAGQPLKLLRE
jgi:predicted Zn-dependent protease